MKISPFIIRFFACTVIVCVACVLFIVPNGTKRNFTYQPKSVMEFAIPIGEVRTKLTRAGLPQHILGSYENPFRVETKDPAKVEWVILENGDETIRFVARLAAVNDRTTSIAVSVTSASSSIRERLKSAPAIENLYVRAMEEQISSYLQNRPFNTVNIGSAISAAMLSNIDNIAASMNRASEQSARESRDNIAKAYKAEAEGTLTRR